MSRSLKAALMVAIGLLLATPGVFAEDSGISVKAEIDQAFITIGDPVVYTVTISHGPDIKVLTSVPPPPENIFKLRKVKDIKREEEGRIIGGRRFELTTFQLGEFILDPVKIQYRAGDGPVKEIETSRIFLTVKSIAGDEEKTDIRDIKSVISMPRRFLKIMGLILLAGMAIAGILFYRRWRKRYLEQQGPEIVLSAEENALLRLNQLFDSDMIRQGLIKQYYLELSEILRVYLEKRFNILAVESTTYEINGLMKQAEMRGSIREKIREVLEFADLAKFAKWKPEPKEILEMNNKTKEIIEECRPQVVEEEKGEVKNGV